MRFLRFSFSNTPSPNQLHQSKIMEKPIVKERWHQFDKYKTKYCHIKIMQTDVHVWTLLTHGTNMQDSKCSFITSVWWKNRTAPDEKGQLDEENRTAPDEKGQLDEENRTAPDEKGQFDEENRTAPDGKGQIDEENRTAPDEKGKFYQKRKVFLINPPFKHA